MKIGGLGFKEGMILWIGGLDRDTSVQGFKQIEIVMVKGLEKQMDRERVCRGQGFRERDNDISGQGLGVNVSE